MSYCRQLGKDKIIFATKEDHAIPSTVTLPEAESPPGLLLPDGKINWSCPCLGGMATGPCGVEFREAFSCFHYSEAEPKGSDCFSKFAVMQECMSRYPALYHKSKGDEYSDPLSDEIYNEKTDLKDISQGSDQEVNTNGSKKKEFKDLPPNIKEEENL